jgi:hypothetical protein
MPTPTSYVYKVLGEGQLAAAKATLYTVPGSTTAAVKSLSVVNTGAGDNTVNIYIKPGATSRKIVSVTLSTGDQLYINDLGTLEAGDLIEGDATNANECDYVISGAEGS